MQQSFNSGFLALALLAPWDSIPALASPQDRVLTVDIPDNVPATIQDRAYTSPIWYTPAK